MPDRLPYWRDRIAERSARELSLDVLNELAEHLAEEEASAGYDRALAVLNSASFPELAQRRRARHIALPSATGWFRDVRLALRHLRRAPGFTATALVTLAIGIGATTAIFTLVHAVLLRSLPVTNADRLFKLGDEYRCCPVENLQGSWSIFPYPFYLDVRDRADVFEEVAAMDTLRHDLSVRRENGTGAAESFAGEFVSGNYFSTLGVAPLAGRLFDQADDRAGGHPVAVISYAAWNRGGFDASAIGRSLTMSGVTVTLIGVAPQGFFGDRLDSRPPDVWLPLAVEPTFTREGTLLESPVAGWLYMVGRLRADTTAAAAQAKLTVMLRNYLREPGHVNRDEDRAKADAQVVRVVPGGGGNNAMRGVYEQGLYLLFAVSASVLLIACANLANLLLVRGATARTAMAVEVAMGASRVQIVRRQLTESLLLSLFGGAAGLITAVLASRAIVVIAFRGTPQAPIDTSLSMPVLVFTFAVSLVTGLLFGVGPAWRAARVDPADALRSGTRVVGDGGWSQRLLVMLQAAMSLVLVTVAALLSQSLRNLDRAAYGFEQDGRLIVRVDPQSAGYTQPRLAALYQRLDERLSRVPGVVSESLSLYTAQESDSLWGARIFIEGGKGPYSVMWNRVGPRYFDAIGTRLVRGRSIDDHDGEDTRAVAVVNEAFASRFFANANPIGHHFGKYTAGHSNDYEIVGVVADAKYDEASKVVRPMFFVPLTQTMRYEVELLNKIEESSRYVGSIELFVRGDPDALTPLVRTALAEVDPNLAPKSMMTFRELIRVKTSQRTLTARLSDAFGIVAVVLAAIGLYGVTAYRVARRKNELGLRMALGASRGDIAWLIVRGAMTQTCLGLLAGIPLALMTARALQSQLFGVSPFNVPILMLSIALVAVCAIAASVVPARRAASLAPMIAFRAD
ncbi:MAG TPA: ABC transporter permease [Vicinamibacterales bacterium]|nr:ABC transporter permease [Vicinamibacterales bacterium]